jgi:hypothetical protein
MPMPQELLDLADVDAGFRKQGGGGGPQRVGAVEALAFLKGPRQLFYVAGDDSLYMLAALKGL